MSVTTQIEKKVDRKDLEQKVKQMYKDVAERPEQEYHFEMGWNLAKRLGYDPELLKKIPKEAIDSFAGVGYYFDLTQIHQGDTILDLGSGAGMDAFYARELTGVTGEVIGIDMTDAQLAKSNTLKTSQKASDNIIFSKGYIEELPIRSNSIDVVISNGVINLSSEKGKVFQEASRVLKSGAKLVFSDIVSEKELPESISCNTTYWAACIGGAMQIDSYLSLIEDAGFELIDVVDNPYAFISKGAMGATQDYGIKSISVLAIKK